MAGICFEWDPRTSASNRRKYGVSFEAASTVFTDEHSLLKDDPEHSADEDRFIFRSQFESPHARCLSLLSAE